MVALVVVVVVVASHGHYPFSGLACSRRRSSQPSPGEPGNSDSMAQVGMETGGDMVYEAKQRACHNVRHHECIAGTKPEDLSINILAVISSEVVVEKLAVDELPAPAAF